MPDEGIKLEPIGTETPKRKDWLVSLRKSKYKPVVVIFGSTAVLVPGIYLGTCLAVVLFVIAISILLWVLKIENIWQQISVGAIAMIVGALLASSVFIPGISSLTGAQLQSLEDPSHFYVAGVNPTSGERNTLYNYSIVIETDKNATVQSFVSIAEDVSSPFGSTIQNHTMSLVNKTMNTTKATWTFSYSTYLNGSINAFEFQYLRNSTWHTVGVLQEGNVYFAYGPVSSNVFTIYSSLSLTLMISVFGYGFIPFLSILLFMRFSAKSRDSRQKMMEDYRKMKTEKDQGRADIGSRRIGVPAKEETFVCSECGADVQASAKFCPNCGEPFDEEDEESGSDEKSTELKPKI